ncbi:MAG: hypothetical protein QOE83_905 [Actinomycetota bacterium]|jgi:predicted amidohydrolase|nr:hypothetical protein [Actinomycetota bacterium]
MVDVYVVQMPLSWDAEENAGTIVQALEQVAPGSLVVTPEGSLSGYPVDGDFTRLAEVDEPAQAEVLTGLQDAARQRNVVLCVGMLRRDEGSWVNEAIVLSETGPHAYRKRNLSENERAASFLPGRDLPVFDTPVGRIGVQLCRELRFPEQWLTVASAGAQTIVHLDAGTADPWVSGVWRSMLVARAHETQRFVVSANCSGERQHAPSLIVHPSGKVLCEVSPSGFSVGHAQLNLDDVSDRYIGQRLPC